MVEQRVELALDFLDGQHDARLNQKVPGTFWFTGSFP